MNHENIELYVSKDIVQGEEVPFYILWSRDDIHQITLEYSGFDSINELYNVNRSFNRDYNTINIEDIRCKNYLGGTLNTSVSGNPFTKANLSVTLITNTEEKIKLFEERILYATVVEVEELPHIINITKDNAYFINIKLRGSTTVFIDIVSAKDSSITIVLPKEIQNAVEQFIAALINGLNKLKSAYPEYETKLNIILEMLRNPELLSEKQYIEKIVFEFDKFNPKKEFIESLSAVFSNALTSQSSLNDVYLRPLLEYLESRAAEKAFLESPFLCVNIPKGRNLLKGTVICENILEREGKVEETNKKDVHFEFFIESNKDCSIPIKEFVQLSRVEND